MAFILFVVLFLLRRYRQQLQDRGQLLEPEGSARDGAHATSMRSSYTPLVAAVAASFKKIRPGSSHPSAIREAGESDHGFQRVAGRKIDPVLTAGGDGYGGNYGAFEKDVGVSKQTRAPSSSHPEAQPLAGTSFYRHNSDFYDGDVNGSGALTPTGRQARFESDNRDFADNHDDDYNRGPSPDAIAIMRPSPARSPVTTSAGPNQLAPPTPTLPTRFIPDGVGRSLISQDGSRGSRFTESV